MDEKEKSERDGAWEEAREAFVVVEKVRCLKVTMFARSVRYLTVFRSLFRCLFMSTLARSQLYGRIDIPSDDETGVFKHSQQLLEELNKVLPLRVESKDDEDMNGEWEDVEGDALEEGDEEMEE